MANDSIVIHGRQLTVETKEIDIFDVDYYRDNPRVHYIVSRHTGDVTSEIIEKALMSMDATKDLVRDIEDNGGLIEAILVLNNQVIEGNTRLCAYRRLYQKHNRSEKWKRIRANVIQDSVTTSEIFSILSNYHIKGKNPWDPYEKAACVARMIANGMSIEDAAREVRSNKQKVETMLKAYETMRKHYLAKEGDISSPNSDVRDDLKKYSYFEAMYTNKDLAKRAEETPAFIDEFVEWVSTGRIPKAQDVRELHNVLNNKKARKTFTEADPEDAFDEAIEVLNYHRPDKVDGFYKRVNQFRELLSNATMNEIRDHISTNPNKKNVLKSLLKDVQRFCKELEIS